MTSLPFVFAAWVSNKKLPKDFIVVFNAANTIGLKKLDEVISKNPYTDFDMKAYYTQNIKFNLESAMFTAMDLFLSKLKRNIESIP